MKNVLLLFLLLAIAPLLPAQHLTTKFEESGGNQSPTYPEIIAWWQKLDQRSQKVKMLTMGPTDAGFPLHLVVISNNGVADFPSIHQANRRVILINNGIHPGEPDGIDASMLMARDIAEGRFQLPDNIVLAIIPVYNIGGCLNRSDKYRVDQDGPEEFGFRGNSQNLDLNRDFIKCDSREARSFAQLFHLADPDVFVDNHVSDGADYQHVMTLLTTQHDKLGGAMGNYLHTVFEPALYAGMKEKGYDLVPYVNEFGDTPESGWPEYWDSPRYGSGYGTLWQCFSFVPETHMLKPYPKRVDATYALMKCFIAFTAANSDAIRAQREQAKAAVKTMTSFPLRWTLDKSTYREVTFKGYAGLYKTSEVSGLPRLYYDRNQPYEKQVKIFDHFRVTAEVEKPTAYIIPQGWWKVIDLLRLNGVMMMPLKKDTTIRVEVYHISDYKSYPRQYEMHHLNYDVKLASSTEDISFRKGDLYIPMNQVANRFIVETLEPQAEDSYFAWNFFDAILGQKEGYSDYHFEDIAGDYLKSHPELQKMLDDRRATDTAFAKSAGMQLSFVYRNSPWFEKSYMRYPVYRVR